jgi:L-iditol 2-dehydrogenase
MTSNGTALTADSMKAIVYEDVRKLSLKEVKLPRAKDDSVIVRVNSCAICGTDVKAYTIGISSIKPPVILGHEFVGTVKEVGKRIKGFQPGDRVTLSTTLPCGRCDMCRRGLFNLCIDKSPVGTFINGAFAEFVEIPYRGIVHGNLMKVPASLSDDDGTLSEPLACVINSQNIAKVGFPDTVVVIGAGPLGLLQAEAAKTRGAIRTILVQRSKPRFEMAKSFDIDHLICCEESDPYDSVMDLTKGRGADVVINAAPSLKAVELAFRLVGKAGRISLFASVPKDNPSLHIDVNLIHYSQLEVYGASDSTAHDHWEAMQLLSSGKISTSSLITHTLPLEEFFKGIDLIVKREALKVVIKL